MNPAEFANIAAAEQHLWWYRGMRRILFRLLDPLAAGRPIERALEAGCGTGYFARLLQQRYDWRVYPVDRGWNALQFGRQLGVPRMTQADIAALPFPDGCFQAVLSLDVIAHLPRGQEDCAMHELVRVLAPGGLLVLRVSALDSLRSRHSEFAEERQRFTRRRLIRLAQRHGIRRLRSSYLNSLLFPVALVKFRIWEPLLRKPPASGVAPLPGWLDRLLYLPLAFESFWLGAGLSFPLGQSVILIGEKERSALDRGM
jgi:SAM-dependent methyltransferase